MKRDPNLHWVNVRNVKNGSANPTCGCSDWTDHWKKNSNLPWPEECCHVGCSNKAEHGGHVERIVVEKGPNPHDTPRYEVVVMIVPLCREHNHSTYENQYEVPSEYLVSANKLPPC